MLALPQTQTNTTLSASELKGGSATTAEMLEHSPVSRLRLGAALTGGATMFRQWRLAIAGPRRSVS
jgi:hypothetical protein